MTKLLTLSLLFVLVVAVLLSHANSHKEKAKRALFAWLRGFFFLLFLLPSFLGRVCALQDTDDLLVPLQNINTSLQAQHNNKRGEVATRPKEKLQPTSKKQKRGQNKKKT